MSLNLSPAIMEKKSASVEKVISRSGVNNSTSVKEIKKPAEEHKHKVSEIDQQQNAEGDIATRNLDGGLTECDPYENDPEEIERRNQERHAKLTIRIIDWGSKFMDISYFVLNAFVMSFFFIITYTENSKKASDSVAQFTLYYSAIWVYITCSVGIVFDILLCCHSNSIYRNKWTLRLWIGFAGILLISSFIQLPFIIYGLSKSMAKNMNKVLFLYPTNSANPFLKTMEYSNLSNPDPKYYGYEDDYDWAATYNWFYDWTLAAAIIGGIYLPIRFACLWFAYKILINLKKSGGLLYVKDESTVVLTKASNTHRISHVPAIVTRLL